MPVKLVPFKIERHPALGSATPRRRRNGFSFYSYSARGCSISFSCATTKTTTTMTRTLKSRASCSHYFPMPCGRPTKERAAKGGRTVSACGHSRLDRTSSCSSTRCRPPRLTSSRRRRSFSAQQALVLRAWPRFLLFSGHTILEALAFESEDGRLDLHADPSFFVTLLETLNLEATGGVPTDEPPLTKTPKNERAVAAAAAAAFSASRAPPATEPSEQPLAARAEILYAHLDKIRVNAAEKIQKYARGRLVRNELSVAFDAYSSKGSHAHRQDKSTARQVHQLLGRFRERLGVEPPSKPRGLALSRLRCVVLNGCQTDEIGRSLVKALPKLAVVCWETVAEDAAARAFAVGFYASVAERLRERSRYRKRMRRMWPRLLSLVLPQSLVETLFGSDPEDAGCTAASTTTATPGLSTCAWKAFEAGCYAFGAAGFRFGDPADYLHPPGHPHSFRPCLKGSCDGCTPPVHGSIVLIYFDPERGELVERRGAEILDDDEGGLGTFAKLLRWRRRAQLSALSSPSPVTAPLRSRPRGKSLAR